MPGRIDRSKGNFYLRVSTGVGRIREQIMQWSKPSVREYCVGMEVTSYESADIGPTDPLDGIDLVTKGGPTD